MRGGPGSSPGCRFLKPIEETVPQRGETYVPRRACVVELTLNGCEVMNALCCENPLGGVAVPEVFNHGYATLFSGREAYR